MRPLHLVRCVVPVLLVFFFATPVSAQEPDTTAQHTTQRDSGAVEFEKKSPDRAVAYSFGGTLLLAPAFGAGLVIGPSFGPFYAGNAEQAWRGIGIRMGGSVLAVIGAGGAFGASWEGQEATARAYEILSVLSLGTIAVSGIYDIATADNSARQYNRTHDLQTAVAPTLGGPRRKQVGVRVTVRF